MEVIVIGAGASGLLAAKAARDNGHSVTVIEKNHRPARKVMITGKGRCNLTNNCSTADFIGNVTRNPRFLYSSISGFGPDDMMEYIQSLGVALKTERGNRVFPQSDKAVDIVDALYNGCRGCKFMFDTTVEKLLTEKGACIGVQLDNGKKLFSDATVVCTGGASYPLTGSTGDGYSFAREAGHTVTDIRPSLVPMDVKESFCSELSGLTLKNIGVSFIRDGKTVYKDFGEMLFTHFGVSGPVILSASANVDCPSECVLSVDLKPALTEEKLDERLQRDIAADINKNVSNMMCGLLPAAMVAPFLRMAQVPADLKCHSVTSQMRKSIVRTLKDFRLHPVGYRPMSEAIVTRGGVNVREIDPKTMRSKICDDLYFAGEVLDVDAYTGGFNLQIAFSTGYTAGNSIV